MALSALAFAQYATRARLEAAVGLARYSRGFDLHKARRTTVLDRRDGRARGIVDDPDEAKPYLVDVVITADGGLEGTCGCPDYTGGSGDLCKHTVGVLLEIVAIEKAEAEAIRAAERAKPPPPPELAPYARPNGLYRVVAELGRPPVAPQLLEASAAPAQWHAHFHRGSLYVWAELDGPDTAAHGVARSTTNGPVPLHPRVADASVVAGFLADLGVSEGRTVDLLVDSAQPDHEGRWVVGAVALAAGRALVVLAALVADPRVELADDALVLAAAALAEVDRRGPARLDPYARDHLDAEIDALWVVSGAAAVDARSVFVTFAGRAATALLEERPWVAGDFAATVVLDAPTTFVATPHAGAEIPTTGWSLHVAVVAPDGTRTATTDPVAASGVDVSARADALRTAVRRCARIIGRQGPELLTGPVPLSLDGVLEVVGAAREFERAGLRLQVPAGLPRPVQLSASVVIDADRPSMLGLEAVCDFAWRVRADGTELGAEELAAIASAKARVVAVEGRWVTARVADLTALRSMLGADTAADALRLAAGTAETGGIALGTVELRGWLAHLAELDERVEPVEPPSGLTCTLYDHQRDALAWLVFLQRCGIGGILADDMGLGKTVSVLALVAHDRNEASARGEVSGPTLVVAPTSVLSVWAAEAERHAPGLRVHVHHGTARLLGSTLHDTIRASDIVVTNYDTLVRDRAALEAIEWRRVVADEAQAAKNPRSRRAQALRMLRAHHKLCVTGTPIENGLVDLWSLCAIAVPGLLGSEEQFRRQFVRPIQIDDSEDAAETLVALLEPFVLARRKADTEVGRGLAELVERDTVVELTSEQQALYDTVVERTLDELAGRTGIARRGAILALLVRLKQIVNHPEAYLRDGRPLPGRSGKFDAVTEMVRAAAARDEFVLVFSQFVGTAELLVAHFDHEFGAGSAELLCGATSVADREDLVARFGSVDGPRVMVVSLKAGGVGLTLTAATHVVLFDRWWNPAVEDQAVARAHRIGQQRTVQVDKLLTPGTIESKIAALLATKRGYAARVLGVDGDVAGRLAQLDARALREVFTRSAALDDGS